MHAGLLESVEYNASCTHTTYNASLMHAGLLESVEYNASCTHTTYNASLMHVGLIESVEYNATHNIFNTMHHSCMQG
jgi:hypothetical protein